jgi:hypothetical protein
MFASPLVVYRHSAGASSTSDSSGSLERVPLGLHPLDYAKERSLIHEALRSGSTSGRAGIADDHRDLAAAVVRQLSASSSVGGASIVEGATPNEATIASLLPLLRAPEPVLSCGFLTTSTLRRAITQV